MTTACWPHASPCPTGPSSPASPGSNSSASTSDHGPRIRFVIQRRPPPRPRRHLPAPDQAPPAATSDHRCHARGGLHRVLRARAGHRRDQGRRLAAPPRSRDGPECPRAGAPRAVAGRRAGSDLGPGAPRRSITLPPGVRDVERSSGVRRPASTGGQRRPRRRAGAAGHRATCVYRRWRTRRRVRGVRSTRRTEASTSSTSAGTPGCGGTTCGTCRSTQEKLRHPRTLAGEVFAALVTLGYDGPPPEFGDRWLLLFGTISNALGPRQRRPALPARRT